jgi:hypothetical protein
MADTSTGTLDRTNEALIRITRLPTAAVEDTALAFGVARATGYAAVKAGEWPAIRVRGRIRIPSQWIRDRLGLDD